MWAAVRRGVVSGNSHGNPAPKRRGRLCNIAAWLGLPSPGGHPCACPPPSWQLQRQRRLVLAARPVLKGLPHKSVVRIADLEGLWPLLPHHGGADYETSAPESYGDEHLKGVVACHRASTSARSLKRWIFPVAVFGNSLRNSIQRGYLKTASLCRHSSCNCCANASLALSGDLSTTKAFGLMSLSVSGQPTTAASSTSGWLCSTPSTSNGETYMPETLSMSSRRPQ